MRSALAVADMAGVRLAGHKLTRIAEYEAAQVQSHENGEGELDPTETRFRPANMMGYGGGRHAMRFQRVRWASKAFLTCDSAGCLPCHARMGWPLLVGDEKFMIRSV
jgi:hypothetical protein